MGKQNLSVVPSSVRNDDKPVSKYRGVYWSHRDSGWIAILYHRKKKFSITHVFQDETNAARAFDMMVKFNGAPLALLNFPEKDERQLKIVK